MSANWKQRRIAWLQTRLVRGRADGSRVKYPAPPSDGDELENSLAQASEKGSVRWCDRILTWLVLVVFVVSPLEATRWRGHR